MAYKITIYSSAYHTTTVFESSTKDDLITSLKHKAEKWIPFLDMDSFKSIELVSGDDFDQFRYKIEKV